MNVILETFRYLVSTTNMIWYALNECIVPGTGMSILSFIILFIILNILYKKYTSHIPQKVDTEFTKEDLLQKQVKLVKRKQSYVSFKDKELWW